MITKTNSLTADILATAVPAWTDAHAAADRLDNEVKRRIADRTDGIDERHTTTDALISAERITDYQSILDAARLDAARRDAENDDIGALVRARDKAQQTLANIEADSTEDVVAEIRARVEAIARKINGLRHKPLSAQQAIEMDAITEWKTLQELAGQWTALSKSHMALVRHEVEGPGISALAAAALTGDVLHTHPYFQARRKQAGRGNTRPRPDSFHEAQIKWSEEAPTPKFNTDEPKGTATPAGADPIEWLLYLVERDALTVYEPGEALDIWAAAVAATDRLTADSAQSRAVARTEYARLIGDEQLETVADLRPLVEQGKRRPPRGSFTG